jgi:uncharacterized protein YjiS (DUF1127 family)
MRNAALFIAQQSGTGAGLLHGLARIARNMVRYFRNRSQIARLADFDDHMLEDLGLTRRDVHDVLGKPFAVDLGHELEYRAMANRRRGWNA